MRNHGPVPPLQWNIHDCHRQKLEDMDGCNVKNDACKTIQLYIVVEIYNIQYISSTETEV